MWNYQNLKNFKFSKLSCMYYILSVRIILKNVKIQSEFKNRIIRLSFFLYPKFRNSERSAVQHLVVPNVDPHPFSVHLVNGFVLIKNYFNSFYTNILLSISTQSLQYLNLNEIQKWVRIDRSNFELSKGQAATSKTRRSVIFVVDCKANQVH